MKKQGLTLVAQVGSKPYNRARYLFEVDEVVFKLRMRPPRRKKRKR